MTTGIYLLVFSSTNVYIGQSIDIENRWKQHFDKFRKGTAAKAMQAEFDKCGFPGTRILLECHKDHLDMMESMYIHANKGPHLLNTSIPRDYSPREIEIATADDDQLKLSTVEILSQLRTATNNIEALEEEVDSLRDDGLVLPSEIEEIKEDNERLKSEVSKLLAVNQFLSKEASKSWWDRLWS